MDGSFIQQLCFAFGSSHAAPNLILLTPSQVLLTGRWTSCNTKKGIYLLYCFVISTLDTDSILFALQSQQRHVSRSSWKGNEE